MLRATQQLVVDDEPRGDETERRATEGFRGCSAALPRLSARELTVVLLVAAAKTDAEIARSLDVTINVVKSYLGEIRLKWQCNNRVGIVVIAVKHGVISLDELPDLAPTGLAALNPAEDRVLALMAQKLTTSQIAERIQIPPGTAGSIERSIRAKWNVSTRAQVIELINDYMKATRHRDRRHRHLPSNSTS